MFPRLLFYFSSSFLVSSQMTPDFQHFLYRKNLEHWDFVRSDLGSAGSFGGRSSPFDVVKRIPVVFIHGNADAALKTSSAFKGWSNSVKYFLSKGYRMSELYGTSWGDTNTSAAVLRFHDCQTVQRLRVFVEAVKAYTGSRQISFVTHSMGVTLGRKLINGGILYEIDQGDCNIGDNLRSSIDVFVGISGANRGLCACVLNPDMRWPTCNARNGFHAGTGCGENSQESCGDMKLKWPCEPTTSVLLEELRNNKMKDAHKVYSLWSKDDELLMFQGMVWGEPTSRIPFSDEERILSSVGHMASKDDTAHIQYNWITKT